MSLRRVTHYDVKPPYERVVAGLETNQLHCERHTATSMTSETHKLVSLSMWRICACDVNGVVTSRYLPEEREDCREGLVVLRP